MSIGWLTLLFFAAYTALILGLALWADRSRRPDSPFRRKAIYALSACVYCCSWSFCGAVGVASRSGIDFLPIFIGPILVFALFHPAIARMIRLAKTQNITSVADLIAARYGKSGAVAATFTVIAGLASIPYIALQIRATAQALSIFVDGQLPGRAGPNVTAEWMAIAVTFLFGILTVIIGTRRLDATEHQRGLMLVIAVESAIKVIAVVVTGAYVSWGLYAGIGALTEAVERQPAISAIIDRQPDPSMWIALIVTTVATVPFLPRQFHVSVVENRNEADVRTAAWFVPLYLICLALFVLPIAVAGLATFPTRTIDPDFTMLALPIQARNPVMALIALIGAISTEASMVIVATMAIAVMISNDLILPLYLATRALRPGQPALAKAPPILIVRRFAIVLMLGPALLFAETAHRASLYSMGLLSLAAIAQIAPAAIGGLLWRRGTARGAIWGPIAGTLVVGYTLLLPTLARSSAVVVDGPLGFDALRPMDLFGLDLAPFAQSMIWSLIANSLVYIGVSLSRQANTSERLQSNIFVSPKPMSIAATFRLRKPTISVQGLLNGVSHYLEPTTARRLFMEWHASRDLPFDETSEADPSLIQYVEYLVASTIGAASSRMVLSLLLQEREMSVAAARQIVDNAAYELQNSRDVLQHAIDVAHDGMAVFDADLRLVVWNRAYRDMFQLPGDLVRVGTPVDVLIRVKAEQGFYGEGSVEEIVSSRLEAITRPSDSPRLYSALIGRVYEVRSVRLHNGGLFLTYSDATKQVTSEEELEAENQTLERRVFERTEELRRLNVELARAKAEAEDANVSKSRFLAAASHDLLQPLSAARLYAASLRERLRSNAPNDPSVILAANVDISLEAVEDILGALLEISHLDAGATRTEISQFAIADIMRQLQTEFEPLARERGLRLRFAYSSLRVSSDRKLLRRLLQNLISNAIKYTRRGGVLVGARRLRGAVRLDVLDTGIGIPADKQKVIFREFERLPAAVEASAGAGLGLSIVERLSRVLKHDLSMRSTVGKGSVFSIEVPRAASVSGSSFGIVLAPQPRQRSLEGLVVAAIDNERHILEGLTALLEGWECLTVGGTRLEDIAQALDRRGRGPDVIVADYHIGEVDGLQVIATLRERWGACPAVLVTADRSPIIKDLANAVDVRVLHKPLKPAALRALLSQWHLVKVAAE
jgi:Na+/proline symporter/signal transduction histidine kinase/CheY-like chemotaxis protein